MKTVTPLDLRRSLGRILDEASAGERFLIARDHHPLAVLISVEDAARLDEPEDGASQAVAGSRRGPGGIPQAHRPRPVPVDVLGGAHPSRSGRLDRRDTAGESRMI